MECRAFDSMFEVEYFRQKDSGSAISDFKKESVDKSGRTRRKSNTIGISTSQSSPYDTPTQIRTGTLLGSFNTRMLTMIYDLPDTFDEYAWNFCGNRYARTYQSHCKPHYGELFPTDTVLTFLDTRDEVATARFERIKFGLENYFGTIWRRSSLIQGSGPGKVEKSKTVEEVHSDMERRAAEDFKEQLIEDILERYGPDADFDLEVNIGSL